MDVNKEEVAGSTRRQADSQTKQEKCSSPFDIRPLLSLNSSASSLARSLSLFLHAICMRTITYLTNERETRLTDPLLFQHLASRLLCSLVQQERAEGVWSTRFTLFFYFYFHRCTPYGVFAMRMCVCVCVFCVLSPYSFADLDDPP